jgi:hypothetical protein
LSSIERLDCFSSQPRDCSLLIHAHETILSTERAGHQTSSGAVGKVDARASQQLIMKLTIPSAGGNGFSRLALKSFERAFDRTDVVLVAQRLPY